MASYFTEQGENEKAKNVLNQILEWNNQRGFEIENKWVKAEISKIESKH